MLVMDLELGTGVADAALAPHRECWAGLGCSIIKSIMAPSIAAVLTRLASRLLRGGRMLGVRFVMLLLWVGLPTLLRKYGDKLRPELESPSNAALSRPVKPALRGMVTGLPSTWLVRSELAPQLLMRSPPLALVCVLSDSRQSPEARWPALDRDLCAALLVPVPR
ncbi:hypothetical protein V8C86DRAFT_2452736 [Haematococcus lacustris]